MAIANPDAAPADRMKTKRMRFNALAIMNDLLHAGLYHRQNSATKVAVSNELVESLNELVELVAACISKKNSPSENRLMAILNSWYINGLVNAEDTALLRDTAMETWRVAQGGTPALVPKRNYVLPEFHGNKSARWQQLPASHMLEQIAKFPGQPINGANMTIAKLDKKQVSQSVRKLVDNFHENLKLDYKPSGDNHSGGTKQHKLSLDPIGQLVKQDKRTRKRVIVSNRYGWSTEMCKDMLKDGIPGAAKATLEKQARLGEDEDHRRQLNAMHDSDSPEDRRPASSGSNSMRSDSYDFDRPGSRSSRGSYRSRSPTHDDRHQDSRHRDGQRFNERGRSPGRDSARQEKWSGPRGRPDTARGNTRNFDPGASHSQSPCHPPNPLPMGQFPSNVGPNFQQYQGQSSFVPSRNANEPYQAGNQYGNQQQGNQYGHPQQGNRFNHGQNRGGYAGGRGDYGGNSWRGGYNNRGQYGGPYHGRGGQSGGRY